jgi:small subunit ribosomal protein S21
LCARLKKVCNLVKTINNKKQKKRMIVVPLKEGENIEKALKKFKRKFEKTGIVKELRSRQAFIKPSVEKRKKMMRAVYVQQLQQAEE